MKKILGIVMLLSVVYVSSTAYAATVYVAFDDTLNFDIMTNDGGGLTGMEIWVNAVDPLNSLTIQLQADGTEAIPVHDFGGLGLLLVPYVEYDTTTTGAIIDLISKPTSLDGDITAPEEMPFSAGLVWSLTHDDPFEITRIELLSYTRQDGFYLGEYQLSSPISYLDGELYTISAVPIPSSLLLFGGGICALIGITRRKK